MSPSPTASRDQGGGQKASLIRLSPLVVLPGPAKDSVKEIVVDWQLPPEIEHKN